MKTAIRIVRALAALALMLTVVIGGAWGLVTVGRLDTIRTTSWSEILTRWLPDSPYEYDDARIGFESYDERDHGDMVQMDICVPIKPR